jgi:uncharacterized protein YdhG (YjbR/CyaY superfamily)
MNNQNYQNIDDYIALQSPDIRERLELIRSIIKQEAPLAAECIKYAMPTYVHQGNLVHFSACKSHLGFYPAPSGILAFSNQLTPYQCSKGAIQFPYNKPLPTDLIKEIVQFRVNENERKAIVNASKKKKSV